MADSNQVWDVSTAIEWMKQLAFADMYWIEEPTSPDDVDGHAQISQALRKHHIGVATGEMCQNRVMFKQLFQAEAIDVCQIDSCRLGGVNEVLSVLLMAAKFGIRGVPTLMVFKGGELVAQHVGAAPKTTIAQLIDRAL